jgi:hypothetical protein
MRQPADTVCTQGKEPAVTRSLIRTLAAIGLVAALAAEPCAAQQALPSGGAAQNADTAARIRSGRVLATNRAVQAAQEKRERAIQAELARLNALPAPPPTFTVAAGGAVITAPAPTAGPALGQGLVVNNTTVFVNVQNGDNNVATNTLVATAQND